MATPILAGKKPGNTTPTQTPAREFGRLGPNTSDLLHGLFDRARDNLTADDLATLSIAGEAAQLSMRFMADLCEGLACLVASDGDTEGMGAGNFQDARSVSNLLFLLGSVADQADGMLTLATAADNKLAAARHAGTAA